VIVIARNEAIQPRRPQSGKEKSGNAVASNQGVCRRHGWIASPRSSKRLHQGLQ